MAAKPIIDARTGKPVTHETISGRFVDGKYQPDNPNPADAGYCLALIVARGSAIVGTERAEVAALLVDAAKRASAPLDAGLRLAAAELTGRADGTMPVRSNAWSVAAQHLASVILQTAGDRV